jgi:hypothetical protein
LNIKVRRNFPLYWYLLIDLIYSRI